MSKIVTSDLCAISPNGTATAFTVTLDTGEHLTVHRDGPNAERLAEAEEVWWNDWPEDTDYDRRRMNRSATETWEAESDAAETAAHDRW